MEDAQEQVSVWTRLEHSPGVDGSAILNHTQSPPSYIPEDGTFSSGYLFGWGKNDYGQLGLGHKRDVSEPQLVGERDDWVYVSTTSNYSLGITVEGHLYSWGKNSFGQLGLGRHKAVTEPTRVIGLDNWKKVLAGDSRALGITHAGELYAWGLRSYESLNGSRGENLITAAKALRPELVPSSRAWIDIKGWGRDWWALSEDGEWFGWGEGNHQTSLHRSGKFAPETVSPPLMPTHVEAAYFASNVSIGGTHALKLSNGSLLARGEGRYGQLGDGRRISDDEAWLVGFFGGNTRSSDWSRVRHDSDWVFAAASADPEELGRGHSLAIDAHGHLYSWGDNLYKQLGRRTGKRGYERPGRVSSLRGVKFAAACSPAHSFAIADEIQD